MIRLHGNEQAEEYPAAVRLKQLIRDCWADIDASSHQSIDIIASAKTYGQEVNDVDVLVCGSVDQWHEIDIGGQVERYNLRNFCLTIEVK